MDRALVVGTLGATPGLLREMTRDATAAQAWAPPAPGEWSIAEVVRHLARGERDTFVPRLRRMLAETRPVFAATPSRDDPRDLAALLDAFGAARAAEAARPQLELVREVSARYDAMPRGEGLDAEIRAAVLGAVGGVELAELAKGFPGVPRSRIRRVLHELRERRRVRCTGRGPRARWEAAPEGGALVGLDM